MIHDIDVLIEVVGMYMYRDYFEYCVTCRGWLCLSYWV